MTLAEPDVDDGAEEDDELLVPELLVPEDELVLPESSELACEDDDPDAGRARRAPTRWTCCARRWAG